MLRSERKWFPRFKRLCKETVQYKDRFHPQHMLMFKVTECVSYRQVEDVLRNRECCDNLLTLVRKIKQRARRETSLMYKKRVEVPYPSFLQDRRTHDARGGSARSEL